ncbi:MAG TPA: NADP-dependent phosphogluconate dehydrogenase [Polyangiaceae bacterium LLY-WYZ-15_(1-7)]|nr:phosphogluconate dehydrogenase (NADP(+)-dependent, decarboxylating) [Myxococcales bacterium]MAT26001.1 phosphogluconate dehydrogenase (NADP(+)-dependent, decarboxylating) [Sandaracinus sp.]HJK89771.1 NADP-dependent phosphogluconate dehydrogenase [Polyangiaceae bacterium LLY-WYZ-15_(1-7)]MBJ72383.1 phosphogluconate dehydrogenase (NADP(+)-dependent, decarboxylating) [Sandaracinus sp.]HJL03210.1 NADP-dependent phosphogluconate dehydrogenase [Polyangiaceae bacterium LLY-WYZ-15_(1-7)]
MELCDVGVIGLGVMGRNLARNFARQGQKVAGYDLDPEAGPRLVAAEPSGDFAIAADAKAFVASLERPRRILLMVNAGKAVDAVLDALDSLLEEDDVVIDGGNSLYEDTDRRNARAEGRPWRFVGMGVSGGAEGALKGPSMMPGGDREAWERLKPVLEASAAVGEDGPCVTYCGSGSAGHFVKMTHNGIEYGDMQLIAETTMLLRRGLGKSGAEVAEIFGVWNEGELESFLIEITGRIFARPDPKDPARLLVDQILDRAGQKGTGRWTVMAAVEMGIPVPTIAAAVDARGLSSFKALRERAEEAIGLERPGPESLAGVSVEDLRDALYGAKIASYTQGFAMLRAASEERGYGIDLGEIARIWTAGCIIRARFLGRIREAYAADPELALLALAPSFAEDLGRRAPAWRRVVSAATAAGLPIPGLAASLTWLDTLTTAKGTANVIQAQRDYFGSHTYRRVDDPDTPVHTDW